MTRSFDARYWLVVGLALGHSGCALDRGRGFATLEQASLEVALEPDGGELVTDRGYTIAVERAAMRVARMDLQERASKPVVEERSDHEHGDEEHVDEEHGDEEHENGEPYSTLVTLGFDSAISMTEHEPVSADGYAPSRELGRSSPERVLVVLERFELEGNVSGADLADAPAQLVVGLSLDTELAFTDCFSSRFVSTLGGGGGTGAARMFSSSHLPRMVGDVRCGYDVIDRMAAFPSRPHRFSSASAVRRK